MAVLKLCSDDDDINHIETRKGYSRDHRPELNQVVLNLICENQAGIPVYMKPASGNSNSLLGISMFSRGQYYLFRSSISDGGQLEIEATGYY